MMKLYRIFAGVSGGFNDVSQVAVEKHPDQESADQSAYAHAVEVFESYVGTDNGLMTWEEAVEEAELQFGDIDEYNQSQLDDMAETIYNEAMEEWIEYWAVETTEEEVTLEPVQELP